MTERFISTTSTHAVVGSIVEDSPDQSESKEPVNPTHTATVPVIKIGQKVAPTAETGLLSAVLVARNEGADRAETQDSSRTTAETQAASVAQKAQEVTMTETPSVLIVEDTTELAEVIQATLERMHMVTTHETHGINALNRFDEVNPDIVLLDIGLPDMTGWKFLEAVKEKRKDQMPVIIIITAYGDPANKLIGKLQNVYSYLVKPFTPDEVEKVVKEALNARTA